MLRRFSRMGWFLIVCGSIVPAISQAAVGRVSGAPAVTPTGAATYSIPLDLPPGTNGLTPRLAFSYNNQRGAGPLGVGWTMSGLSTITRCNSTFAQDGLSRNVRLDNDDRYCLDGQKLRLTAGAHYSDPGSQYATEIESFSRITANGTQGAGPASFTVERNDGLIYEYGNTADSRIEVLGYISVRAWAVNKIRDRSGNAITFTYTEDTTNGSYRISSIQYTSNAGLGIAASHQVDFVYESLPVGEYSSRYFAGGLVKRVVRLQQVNITHGADLVRRYQLTYEPTLSSTLRSRLAKIEECAGAALDCYPATTFGYQGGSGGFSARAPVASIGGTSNILLLDLNGDGRSDVVYSSSAVSGTGTWVYALAGADGFAAPQSSGIINYGFERAIPIDYNADGLEDVLVPYSGGTWWVMLGTATGLAAPFNIGIDASTDGFGDARAMDVTGDGLDDLVWSYFDITGMGGDQVQYRPRVLGGTFGPISYVTWQAGYGVNMESPVFQTNQFASRHRSPDFNGDGLGDVIVRYSRFNPEVDTAPVFWTNVWLGGGAGAFSIPNVPNPVVYFPDLNGDGYSDIVYAGDFNWYYHLSSGTSMGPRISGPSISGYDVANAVVIDNEVDGYDDFWVRRPADNYGYLMRSTSEALLAPSNTLFYDAGTKHFVADVNGDGRSDVLQLDGSTLYYQLNRGTPPDLLVSVQDGLNNQVSFSYSALNSPNGCYSRDSAAPTFPARAYLGPRQVVCSITSSDGNGGTYSLSYFYSNAAVDLQGRGFLGFGKRRIEDSRRTKLTTVEEYSTNPLAYEKLGALLSAQVRQSADGSLVSQQTYGWSRHVYNSGPNERRLPYLQQTTAKEYEAGGSYNGALLRTVTTTNQVDAATGAVYNTETTAVEASGANGVQAGAIYSSRVYQPLANITADQNAWCRGHPGRIEITRSHNQYAGSSLTRTEEMEWDTAKCRPTKIVSEPGNGQLQVTRNLSYDSFGNIELDKVSGAGVPERATIISWGTTGRFPISVTNPLLQVTSLGWDAKSGLQTSQTDPNNLTVSWQYDDFGRRTRESRPDGTASTWAYQSCSSGCGFGTPRLHIYFSELDTAGATITDRSLYVDSLGRGVALSARSLSGSYSRIVYQYDSLGRITRESAPCWTSTCQQYGTTYGYDMLDRVISISYPLSDSSDSPPQIIATHYEGLTTRSVDALDKQSVWVRNVLGGMARSIDHNGYYQNFDYDAFANVVRVVDSQGSTLISNTFNLRGMKTDQTDLVAGTRAYTPNALGEVLLQTDGNNQSTSFEYDLLGRLKKRIEPEGTSEWIWGTSASARNIGGLASVTGPGYSESYAYDALGRLQSTVVNSDASYQIDYAYNSLGMLHTLTYPTSTSGYRLQLQYEYQNGALYRVKDASMPTTVFWAAADTDARGNVISETLGNGVQTIRGFDSFTGLPDYIQSGLGQSIQILNYTWNAVGSLTQRQDARQGLTEQFFYDDLHRLTSTTGPDPMSFTYDARGGILSSSGSGVSSGAGHTVTWTSYNLPNTITGAAGSASQFFYAPDRSRYKQLATYGGTPETTMYIGGLVEKVTVGTTEIWRHYIAGATGTVAVYTRRSTGVNDIHYVTRDHLGSVDSVTSVSGAVELRASFGAFGQRRKEVGWNGSLPSADWTGIASTTRHGFTDHEMLDNLRLVHMNGRVYDSGVGEFLSPDPFVPAPAFTQSFNRYGYVFNNPLSFTDPSGFEPNWDEKLPWLWTDLNELFGGDPTDQALQNVRVFDHVLRNWQTIATTQNDPKQWENYVLAHADAVVTERESSLPVGSAVGEVTAGQDLLGEIARATISYKDLQATVLARAEKSSKDPIPLSPQELNVLFEYEYFTTLAQPRPTSLSGNEGLFAQYEGYDTFLRSPNLTSRQFIIDGDLYEGGHINYIAVGMLAAHHGPDGYGSIPQLVAGHNMAQMVGFRGGGGLRNRKDIWPGTQWALIGADYYKARSRRRFK